MKKWWYSIVCYIVGVLLLIYSFAGDWFLDNKTWWMVVRIISTLGSFLLLIIGFANQPRKDNKDE